jgi:hypothetical protein
MYSLPLPRNAIGIGAQVRFGQVEFGAELQER